MSYAALKDRQTVAAPLGRVAIGSPSASSGTYGMAFWALTPRDHIVGRGTRSQPLSEELLRKEFKKHQRKWQEDTQYSSSLTVKYLHPSYARVIGMGSPVVPIILQSLKEQPNDWFYALRAITGANPVKSADAGDIMRMAEVWLRWGQKRSLCD